MANSFMTPLGLLIVVPSEKRDINPDLLNLLRSIKCFLPVVCQVTHMFSTAPQTSGPPQADKIPLIKLQKTRQWETIPPNHSHLENLDK